MIAITTMTTMTTIIKKIMDLRVLILCFLVIYIVIGPYPQSEVFAANSQTNTDNNKFATVDTAPGAAGYFTAEVNIRKASDRGERKVFFSIGGTGVMTITLQFKRVIDTDWNDLESYTGTPRLEISGGAVGERWRAIVKQGAYTSGTKIFGFGW